MEAADLIPSFRTKLSMIFAQERGRVYVEEQAHGSPDDRGAEASRGGARSFAVQSNKNAEHFWNNLDGGGSTRTPDRGRCTRIGGTFGGRYANRYENRSPADCATAWPPEHRRAAVDLRRCIHKSQRDVGVVSAERQL
jgi:hypothetical protein